MMKRVCILMVTLALLSQACSPHTDIDMPEEQACSPHTDIDMPEEKDHITAETNISSQVEAGVLDQLEDLQIESKEGFIQTTMSYVTDITSFKSSADVEDFLTAPFTYNDGQYTYVMRRFPEELSQPEEYYEYINDLEHQIRAIDVYENYQYNEPVETIYIEGLENNCVNPYAFTYNPEKKEFYFINNQEKNGDYIPVFYTYSREGKMINQYELIVSDVSKPLLCYDGISYSINKRQFTGHAGELVAENPENGETKTIDEAAIYFFITDNTFHYIRSRRTEDYRNILEFCMYDPAVDETTIIMEINTDKAIVTASYDTQNEILYFSDYQQLFAYQDGELKLLLQAVETSVHVDFIQDAHMFTRIGYNQVSVYQLEEDPSSITDNMVSLNFCYLLGTANAVNGLYKTVLNRMTSNGINIELNCTYLTSSDDEYVNTMAKKLLSGDTDFDIFYIDSTMTELLDEDYYEDLSQYSVLTDYYDKMIPGIKELCTINGKLSLVPFWFMVNGMRYYSSHLSEPLVVPSSYDELYTFYDEVADDLPKNCRFVDRVQEIKYLEIWYEELASNYMAGVITDETAKNDLTGLYEDMLMLNRYANSGSKFFCGRYDDHDYLLRHSPNDGEMYESEDWKMISLPKISDEYKSSVDSTFIAVNPKSPNKELALTFVSYYLQDIMTDERRTSGLYFEAADGVPERADRSEENNNYVIFKEAIANSIRRSEIDGLYDHLDDINSELVSGTLTPSEAASRTLRYLKMIRDE